MARTEIRVPDRGDFSNVPVVEVLVSIGDDIGAEDALVSVESDKATMDIPSPVSGRIVSITVKPGDLVSEGSLLGEIEVEATESPGSVAGPAAVKAESRANAEAFDLVVIGAGPGGYSAAFRGADLGLNVALIDRWPTLGGVCLNVGCIPSKALLHLGAVKDEAERLTAHGVRFGKAEIDLDKVRAFKSDVVSRLTDGLSLMAGKRGVTVIQGTAQFSGTHEVNVKTPDASERVVGFRSAIIAAGSEPVKLPFLPEDDRIVDSTGALDLPFVPKKMLVIGGGIIGLEMATVYSALGARIDVVEMAGQLFPGVDADLVAVWKKRNAHRFDRIMLSTQLEKVEAGNQGLTAHFSNDHAAGSYDLILVAAGRTPNGDKLNVEAAGLRAVRGFIGVDVQMRTSVPHIFAIGDIVGQPMLAHKAVHEGHVAAEVIAGEKAAFDPMQIPSVAYTDPEIAWTGLTEAAAKSAAKDIKVARFPWAASGRAIASGADYGLTKLIFDASSGRVLGGAIVGPHAGDMIGEVSLAIEMGADAIDIGKTIHPHPTMGETIGLAAEVSEGICTDLLPQKR